jgi:hypothetical protein
MISLTAPMTSRDRRVFTGGSAKRPWLHLPDDPIRSKAAATRQAPPFTQPRDQSMRRYSSVPDPITWSLDLSSMRKKPPFSLSLRLIVLSCTSQRPSWLIISSHFGILRLRTSQAGRQKRVQVTIGGGSDHSNKQCLSKSEVLSDSKSRVS